MIEVPEILDRAAGYDAFGPNVFARRARWYLEGRSDVERTSDVSEEILRLLPSPARPEEVATFVRQLFPEMIPPIMEPVTHYLRRRSAGEPGEAYLTPVAAHWLLEVAVEAKALDLLPELIAAVGPLLGFACVAGGPSPEMSCPARLLGTASFLLGRPDEARRYYAQALEVCEKVRFRPEIALIRLDLAELLLEHYPDERAAAIEHLDFAISEFQEMKMQPSLERALRHRGLLKA